MHVIITGSTKGLGKKLAEEFLKRSHSVTICSRTAEQVSQVVQEFSKKYKTGKIAGIPCDVSNPLELVELANFGIAKFGRIDYWINNAGTNAYIHDPLVDFPLNKIETIIRANLCGTLYGCKIALQKMLPEKHGHIFNMEGLGSRGRTAPGMVTYGATKRSIPYITKSLVKETKGSGVGIHNLSPGMMLTDLLLKETTAEGRKIFNILADPPERVAAFLVQKILHVKGTGKNIAWLTKWKAFWRFLTAFRRKNQYFDDQGNLH